ARRGVAPGGPACCPRPARGVGVRPPPPAVSPLPGRPAVHASSLLLRLADRCRGFCQHGHRRQRAPRLLAVVPANPDRIWLGPGRDGGGLLVRLCGVGGGWAPGPAPRGRGGAPPPPGGRGFLCWPGGRWRPPWRRALGTLL